ncbi:MAG: ribosome small subunit-dependent GTPase A [Gammaproteobacteria bacterium]
MTTSGRRNSGRQIPHGNPEPGRVVAAYGRRALVEDLHGERHRSIMSGRQLRPVCGDRVEWARPKDSSDALIVRLLPRDNELSRPDRRGRKEILAANVSQLIVVSAAVPKPDPFLVDRYLAMAELMPARARLVYNKMDLDADSSAIDLEEFRHIGYPVHRLSARDGSGLEELKEALRGQTSILVGQSGVGKSSLINAILPGVDIETSEVSTATGEGKHTTTASVLHHLPGGSGHELPAASSAEIIDSPGVRDFAPSPVPGRDVVRGFREFADPSLRCRFNNCMHLREPDCGVKEAVDSGDISARRYESYRRLVRLMDELGENT